MRFFTKNPTSFLALNELSYDVQGDRIKIRTELLIQQNYFCAYSEKRISEIDEVHIEHFNPRLKGTTDDSYLNWYATISWMNLHKPRKIEDFLPILNPVLAQGDNKIIYNANTNLFEPVDLNDIRSINLIGFLGFNKNELVIERQRQINRVKFILNAFNNNTSALMDYFDDHRNDLSFPTALEKVFNIDLSPYIN